MNISRNKEKSWRLIKNGNFDKFGKRDEKLGNLQKIQRFKFERASIRSSGGRGVDRLLVMGRRDALVKGVKNQLLRQKSTMSMIRWIANNKTWRPISVTFTYSRAKTKSDASWGYANRFLKRQLSTWRRRQTLLVSTSHLFGSDWRQRSRNLYQGF